MLSPTHEACMFEYHPVTVERLADLALVSEQHGSAPGHTGPRSSKVIRSSLVRASTPTWARRRRSGGRASTTSLLPARPGGSCAVSWAPSHVKWAATSTL